jgi:hypothetical protein
MILPIDKKPQFPIQIDLTGPDGNVFALMGIARNLAKTLNQRFEIFYPLSQIEDLRDEHYFDADAIVADMKSSNYEHALEVLEKHFGDKIIMYR